ncbi:hypothetical protein BKA62DRAFT_769790 [Auriculariales sp. MPI-PUGE-AT-0066]|nr:hypothetical protein BKA62DRAFT_769790 [Auriculariales sp. MPI-PUGE-AT-0066]
MARDWQDMHILLLSGRALQFTLCICFGTYTWEFLTSLPFDWAVFTGKLRFSLAVVPYMIARYMLLLALIAALRAINVFEPIDCVAWYHLVYSTGHICVAMASLLLLLRVIAITERNKYVMIFLGPFFLAQCGTLVHVSIAVRSVAFPAIYACGAGNTVAGRGNTWVSLAFDTACTVVMLIALLQTPGRGFWKLLGLIYFVVATVSHLIVAVFLVLNLNDAINTIPQAIAVMALVICSTRLYRDLTQYRTESTDYHDASIRGTRLEFVKSDFTDASVDPVSRTGPRQTGLGHGSGKKTYPDDYDIEIAITEDERERKVHPILRENRSDGDISVVTVANIGEFSSRDHSYTVDNGIHIPVVFPPDSKTGVLQTTPVHGS